MSEQVADRAPAPAPPRRARGPFLIGLVGGLLISALLVVPPIVGSARHRLFGAGGLEVGFPGLIVPLLLLAGLAWLITWIGPRLSRGDSALALVRERYARGEIDDAEYGRILEGLRHDHK